MKVLVTYYSQSGNTEKIAKAIYEESSKSNEANLKKIDELNPDMIAEYDYIFIGSPLLSANIAPKVKECLANFKETTGQKMAGFITHFAPAYPEQAMNKFTGPIQEACEKNSIEYKGCFDCTGFLVEANHAPVKKKLQMDDEKWDKFISLISGHPDEEDENNAKLFTKEILA